MTPLHKQWSAWLITAMGILTALEPFFPQIQAALPIAWQAPVAVAIIILRTIKQGPKPPTGGAGSGLLVTMAALVFVGCGAPPEAVTPAMRECVDLAEERKDLELKSCGENSEGECDRNRIRDRRKASGQTCLGGES